MQRFRSNFDISDEHRYLIDFSNIRDGLIANSNHSFCNNSEYVNYKKNQYLGIPMLLPNGLEQFNYYKNDYFTIAKDDIASDIFSLNNSNYIGVKLFTYHGERYSSYAEPKDKYLPFINWVSQVNEKCKLLVNEIKSSGKTVCSFQTRNIPHYGHERIIEEALKKCDYVVINPIIGLKKKGDFKYEVIEKSFSYLIDNFYDERVIYSPIIANMFYAGPREACHHALLRQNIGFTHFIVGRDHAGAEGAYNSNEAFNLLSNNSYSIAIMALKGAYYCKKAKKAIIKDVDSYYEENITNISGSEFRDCIISKDNYKYARPELQSYIKTLKGDLFE